MLIYTIFTGGRYSASVRGLWSNLPRRGVNPRIAFRIEKQHLEIKGRDGPASIYLEDTLRANNGKEENLVAIHSDGDGHCLTHSI